MKTELTQEQFDRLPKYAQRYIQELERRSVIAARVAANLQDDQTPTNIWTDDLENYDGDNKLIRRYFKATDITIEQNGVQLNVSNLWRPDQDIRLSWGPAGSLSGIGTIALVPTAHQQCKLVNVVYDHHELERLIKYRDKGSDENV